MTCPLQTEIDHMVGGKYLPILMGTKRSISSVFDWGKACGRWEVDTVKFVHFDTCVSLRSECVIVIRVWLLKRN